MMEFQLSCFRSWKMMLWKCCTQYASKFGKLSSGLRTGKGEFSFQSQRKAMPKNAQNYRTIALTSHASKVMLKILRYHQGRLFLFQNEKIPFYFLYCEIFYQRLGLIFSNAFLASMKWLYHSAFSTKRITYIKRVSDV